MRRFLTPLLSLLMLILILLPADAAENQVIFTIGKNSYCINEQTQAMDAATFVESGRTYVPLRYLALSLGVPADKINWNSADQIVTLEKDGIIITLAVSSKVLHVNYKPQDMDVAPVAKNGRTYLPARYIAEALGYQVEWDANTQAVLIGPAGKLPELKPSPSVKVLQAFVTRVVDGDTINVNMGGKEEKVRFIGVDTPESTREVEPYGKEAAAYTMKRLNGQTVYLELDAGERDKYGRLLAYVWLSPPKNDGEAQTRAKMFNAELLLEGYAQVMTVPPNVKYADLFSKFQREARERNAGLWGTTPIPAPGINDEAKYIGNANSKKFHRPDCEWAQKIAPGNRVEFETSGEAVEAGYVPCKVCRP